MNANQSICVLNKKGPSLPLKLADQFTYLSGNISSTENDVHSRLEKPWNAVDKLSITWKSDLSDKIKVNMFEATIWIYHMDTNKNT